MANTQAICTSFKKELLQGVHAFGPATGAAAPARSAGVADNIFAALFFASSPGGILGAGTTAYSTTGEVTNSSGTGYTPGGVAATIPAANVINNGTSGVMTPSVNFIWNALTITTAFDAVLLYNSSQGNKAISVHTFGAQTITAGTLTLQMPSNVAGSALIELA